MPKVFISYRRDDSAYATHAIYKHLAEHYGSDSVVFDVDSIPLGVDFVEYLNEQVSQCDALLVIIGSGWVDARSEDGTRRLDDPDDFVQIEIKSALTSGVPVIPVLVDRASMPRKDDLPQTLKPLSRRNAAEVRPGRDYQSHLELLVRGLDHLFEHASRETGKAATPKVATKTEGRILPRAIESGEAVTNSIGMQLKLIPAGEFDMGEGASTHKVRITNPFYMGIHPVTQEDYERVTEESPSMFKGDRRPVESVSWYDAVSFCNKLSDQEGCNPYYKIDHQRVSIVGGTGYRLPTEAEWEYACRAGTTTRWSCGDSEQGLEAVACYGNRYADVTSPVGEKSQIRGAFTTCTEMYGSGAGIGTENTKVPSRLTPLDRHRALTVFCVAARSTMKPPTVGPPFVAAASPATLTIATVSAYRRRTLDFLYALPP